MCLRISRTLGDAPSSASTKKTLPFSLMSRAASAPANRSSAARGSSSAGNSAMPRLSKTLAKPGNSGASFGRGGGIVSLVLAVAALAVHRRAHLEVLLDLPADLVGTPAGRRAPRQVRPL